NNIILENEGIGRKFQELIQKLHAKTGRKVVVLIDEYDKAIVDYLEELETAEANRNTLKSFYGILKPADEHLELVLLTGVSKFAKVSVFSDLNNLNDISLDEDYSNIVGFTQAELETDFAPEIKALAARNNRTESEFLAEIKHWYNGYSWGGLDTVYNPFSLLNFFAGKGSFRNFWFSTGTPTWLVKELQDKKMYDVEGIQSDETILSNFDYYHINPSTLLFQTGYLTIKHYDTKRQLYTLGYPNEEVRVSFMIHLSNAYRSDYQGQALPIAAGLEEALNNGDVAEAMQIINVVFSTIPYDLWQRENEHFYHALIHLTFTLLGVYVQSEVHTSRGRCDAVVQTKDYIYAFEFKLDKTAQEALDQIAAKGYLAPYAQSGKQCVAVGANFSTPLKAVESWLTAEVL
ncbi:MAG: AAA family ATPase, partial [Bacteroidetes bacterium]